MYNKLANKLSKKKHNKLELAVILVIVLFLTLNFFLPKVITGFVSFSIYPEEPAGSDTSNTNESFGIVPIEESSLGKNIHEENGFGILPIEEKIETKEENFSISLSSPTVNYLRTEPSIIYYNTLFYLTANITDSDPGQTISWVNFTIVAPNGSILINNLNGTVDSTNNIWNSSSLTITQFGNWTYNLTTSDNSGGGAGSLSRMDEINFSVMGATNTSFGSFYVSVFNENVSWYNNLTGVYESMIGYADLENDGNLDLVLFGRTGPLDTYIAKIYLNNGTSLVESVQWENNLTAMGYGSLSFGDYDNDGRVDLAVCGGIEQFGELGIRDQYEIKDSSLTSVYTFVYNNNGTSLVSDSNHNANLSDVGRCSLEWSDLENDGDLDLVLTGEDSEGQGRNRYAKVYVNNGTGLYESGEWEANLTKVYYSSIHFGDLNNDKYQDLILTGHSTAALSKVFINNGTALTENVTWQSNLTKSYRGDVVLGDINNDTKLDLILTGDSPGRAKVFINNGTALVDSVQWQSNLTGVIDSSTALGDIDNDGDLDLVLTGGTTRRNKIFINNGTSFEENKTWYNNITAVDQSSITLIDINNDTMLELAMTGNTGTSYISKIYSNHYPATNTKPNAPTSLTGSFSGNSLTISFNSGSDTETNANGLYYNLRIGNSSGSNNVLTGVFGGHGRPSGGYFGNLEQQRSITISGLIDQDYYCGVQTIDAGYMKSDWYNTNCYAVPVAAPTTPPGGGISHGTPPAPTPPAPPVAVHVEKPSGGWACKDLLNELTAEEAELIRGLYGEIPCWIKLDITSKYKCNGIEFNINDTIGFSFSIYENKPLYNIDLDFDPNKEKYCPWCYNKIQDYDETGIDCGGSCPPCVEKPLEVWKCEQIPIILILLLAMLLAICIYGYKKADKLKYEFRIGVSVSLVALISCIICRYLGVCYYKYLAFLYCLGIIVSVFIIVKEIKYLRELSIVRKLKIFKHKIKLPEIKLPEKEFIDIEKVVRNSIIEFNTLVKKIKLHIGHKKYDKAYHDYNALNAIYEYLIDKVDGEKLNELYNILEELYSNLFTCGFKEELSKLKEGKLRETPYKFKLEIPKIRYREVKEEISAEEHQLDKVHKLLKENKLDEAAELYNKYSKFYLPRRQIELDLEKIKLHKLKKIIEPKKVREELSEEERRLNEVHRLIKEGKAGLPKRVSDLKLGEIKVEEEKPRAVDKFDSEFSKLIDLVRKGKYKDAERKYGKLFK